METRAYFEDIQYYILKELRKARHSILAAIAWFTDEKIYNVLCQKASEGKIVELILVNDDINKASLDFKLLKSNNGKVYFIGKGNNFDSLMHNKFCIIDNKTIISGSYNWSRQAQRNYENITIIKDNEELLNKFIEEFHNIKTRYAGRQGSASGFDYAKITRRLETIKHLIILEDVEDIQFQKNKLKQLIRNNDDYEHIDAINNCINFIESQAYNDAFRAIEEFLTKYRQVAAYEDLEIPALKLEIKILEIQLTALENEKADIEKMSREFETRYNKELGQIILKILKLRRDKLKRDAKHDNRKEAEYKEAERDYKEYRHGSDEIKKEKSFKLSDEERKEIKNKYRKATKLCHPDIVVDELKDKAAAIFHELTQSYEQNNLRRVKEILESLEKGNWFVAKSEKINLKVKLKAQASELRMKTSKLIQVLTQLKESETNRTITKIKNWDDYFEEKKEQLLNELNILETGND